MTQTPEFAPAFVSVVNEFPEDLYNAMRAFVRTHPHWDQYRLMQVAVAGFLFQQGSRERAVARHYLDGLFDRGAAAHVVATAAVPSAATSDATPVEVAGGARSTAGSAAAGLPQRHPQSAGTSSEGARPLRRRAVPSAAAAPSLRAASQPLGSHQPSPGVSRLAS